MERRIDKLEERLQAIAGALRLRGEWTPAPTPPDTAAEPGAGSLERLRAPGVTIPER